MTSLLFGLPLSALIMHGTKRATRVFRFNARALSTSPRFAAPSSLKINADRLWETLHETCKWGAAHPYGEYVHSILLSKQLC